jgi:two-component system, response regulator PdtaR
MTTPLAGAQFSDDPGTKMLSSQRLLIIEGEFLIALEIQRILEGANASQTVFARDFREAGQLAERFGEFDLAIINPPLEGTPEVDMAARLARSGPAIVICTAGPIDLDGTPLAGVEVVRKPFADGDLLAACQRAFAKRLG